jgi:hypothetical protein
MFDLWQFALCSWHCIFCICSVSATGGNSSLLKHEHVLTHLYSLLRGLAGGVWDGGDAFASEDRVNVAEKGSMLNIMNKGK